MTNRGWGALAAAFTTLLVLGSVSACDRADEHTQFKIDAAAVSGPDTLGLSAVGEPIKAVVVYFHGMDENADVTQSDVKHKSFVQALLRAGYAVVSADTAISSARPNRSTVHPPPSTLRSRWAHCRRWRC
jgi:hypothetical protein